MITAEKCAAIRARLKDFAYEATAAAHVGSYLCGHQAREGK